MEEFADELFGDGFGEYPLLLRPLIGTMIVVKAGAKFLFYFGLPIVLGFIFLGGAIALIIVSIGCLSDKLSKKDENGTRKKVGAVSNIV